MKELLIKVPMIAEAEIPEGDVIVLSLMVLNVNCNQMHPPEILDTMPL